MSRNTAGQFGIVLVLPVVLILALMLSLSAQTIGGQSSSDDSQTFPPVQVNATEEVAIQDETVSDIEPPQDTDATGDNTTDDDRDPQIVEIDRAELQSLRSQVLSLTDRVATLERLLLSQIIEAEPDDVDYLHSSLELAEARLEHSQQLFEKGYISELQLSADRFAVERANLRLELAAMAADQAEFAASLQLFEAQASLDMALQRLENSERLAARGYITQAQLRADQLDVERLRARVESMQRRLEPAIGEEEEP